jgi:hypothetical protein
MTRPARLRLRALAAAAAAAALAAADDAPPPTCSVAVQVGLGASGTLPAYSLASGTGALTSSQSCSGYGVNGNGKNLHNIVIPGGVAAGGTLSVSVCGASYDTVLYVGTGCPPPGGGSGWFTCLRGNDDYCGASSYVNFVTPDVADGVLTVLVGSYYSGGSGSYALS